MLHVVQLSGVGLLDDELHTMRHTTSGRLRVQAVFWLEAWQ